MSECAAAGKLIKLQNHRTSVIQNQIKAIVLFTIILLIMPVATARYLPDKCAVNPGFVCKDFSATWGTNGTDGTLTLMLEEYKGTQEITQLLIKNDEWNCLLSSSDKESWKNSSERKFNSSKCDFLSLDYYRFKGEIYANGERIGTLLTFVENSPSKRQAEAPLLERIIPFVISISLILAFSVPAIITLRRSIRIYRLREKKGWNFWGAVMGAIIALIIALLITVISFYLWSYPIRY